MLLRSRDLAWWIQQDRNKALRIVNLIKDVQRDLSKGSANRNRFDTNSRVAGLAALIRNIDLFIKS